MLYKRKNKHMNKFLYLLLLIVFTCSGCQYISANTFNTTKNNPEFNKPLSLISFELKGSVKLTGPTSKIQLKIALPQTINERQTITKLQFFPQPKNIIIDGGTKYAEYEFINPTSNFDVIVKGEATLLKYDLKKALNKNTPNVAYNENFVYYTRPEEYIESNNNKIKQIASSINGRNELETVTRIYKFVLKNMSYDSYNPKDVGAELALTRKQGDCSEYTDLMIALCRAKNIPAKVNIGYTSHHTNTPKHAWVDVYIKNLGWVPFDPTLGDYTPIAFDSLEPKYLYITNKRTDTLLNKYYYMSYYYWGSPIVFQDTFQADIIK